MALNDDKNNVLDNVNIGMVPSYPRFYIGPIDAGTTLVDYNSSGRTGEHNAEKGATTFYFDPEFKNSVGSNYWEENQLYNKPYYTFNNDNNSWTLWHAPSKSQQFSDKYKFTLLPKRPRLIDLDINRDDMRYLLRPTMPSDNTRVVGPELSRIRVESAIDEYNKRKALIDQYRQTHPVYSSNDTRTDEDIWNQMLYEQQHPTPVIEPIPEYEKTPLYKEQNAQLQEMANEYFDGAKVYNKFWSPLLGEKPLSETHVDMNALNRAYDKAALKTLGPITVAALAAPEAYAGLSALASTTAGQTAIGALNLYGIYEGGKGLQNTYNNIRNRGFQWQDIFDTAGNALLIAPGVGEAWGNMKRAGKAVERAGNAFMGGYTNGYLRGMGYGFKEADPALNAAQDVKLIGTGTTKAITQNPLDAAYFSDPDIRYFRSSESPEPTTAVNTESNSDNVFSISKLASNIKNSIKNLFSPVYKNDDDIFYHANWKKPIKKYIELEKPEYISDSDIFGSHHGHDMKLADNGGIVINEPYSFVDDTNTLGFDLSQPLTLEQESKLSIIINRNFNNHNHLGGIRRHSPKSVANSAGGRWIDQSTFQILPQKRFYIDEYGDILISDWNASIHPNLVDVMKTYKAEDAYRNAYATGAYKVLGTDGLIDNTKFVKAHEDGHILSALDDDTISRVVGKIPDDWKIDAYDPNSRLEYFYRPEEILRRIDEIKSILRISDPSVFPTLRLILNVTKFAPERRAPNFKILEDGTKQVIRSGDYENFYNTFSDLLKQIMANDIPEFLRFRIATKSPMNEESAYKFFIDQFRTNSYKHGGRLKRFIKRI